MTVQPIPQGFHTVTPYIIVQNAAGYIEFLKKAFGATEKSRVTKESDRVAHATLQIGDSCIMLAEAATEGAWAADWGTSPVTLYVYVPNADAVYEQALQAGAFSIMEIADQLYGDRTGCVKDAWGNKWCIATHLEDVPDEEVEKRFAAAGK